MGGILARFLITAAAIPLCAHIMDGVVIVDMTNTLIVGAILGGIYTLLRPVIKLVLKVINFCTLGLVSVFVDAWCIQLIAGLVPQSVTFDSYWWAVAVAFAINACRMLVDVVRKENKRKK